MISISHINLNNDNSCIKSDWMNVLGALAAKFSMSPLNMSSLARASSLAFTQNESASSFVEWTCFNITGSMCNLQVHIKNGY